MVNRNCPVCNVEYLADPKRLKWGRQTTCSRKCSYVFRANQLNKQIECNCGTCGKVFYRSQSHITTKHNNVFCSTDCQYTARTKNITPRIVDNPYNIVRKTEEEKKETIIKWRNIRKEQPKYKLINAVRSRLAEYLKQKGYKKDKNTFNIIGCTPDELRQHIEKQFKIGMTWENYGHETWHIDHIIPISSGKNKDEIYKLSHYSNLQPLWAEENYEKSNRIL
jgi:hypothetical protein